jgi:hypothetical protein
LGWTVYSSSQSQYGWRICTTAAYNHNSSTGSAQVGIGTSTVSDQWLISQPIHLTANTMKFWMRDNSTAPASDHADEYTWIKVSTTTNNPTAFATTLGAMDYLDTSTNYICYGVDLTAYLGQTIYIAFDRHCTGGNYVYLDDLSILQENVAVPVITASQITTGVQISWTPCANALCYNIYSGATPTGPWTYAGTSESNSYLDTTVHTSCFYKVCASNSSVQNTIRIYPVVEFHGKNK